MKPTPGEALRLETCGAAGLWPIEADETQLQTSLVNLAINARDAMPNGGKLTIEASNVFLDESYADQHTEVKAGQYVLISVTDCGAGMTAEVRARAFDPFFTTKGNLGTGLGLSKYTVSSNNQRGISNFTPEPGEGTSVHMYLPRSYAAMPAAEHNVPRTRVEGGTETILVVEDDEQVRNFVCETLTELKYQVLRAGNAEEALRILDKSPNIDLPLTDVVLPGMNGRLLCAEITKRRANIRVLFMTGYSRNAIVHQGRLDPGVQLIQKPLTQSTLASKVRRVLVMGDGS